MAPSTSHGAREKAKRVSPLLLTTEMPDEWTMVKVEFTRADGTIGKHSLPSTSAPNPEHLLYVLFEFHEACTQHGWQGQERFQKFRELLLGNAKTQWDLARAQGPPNYQAATFDAAIRRMIGTLSGSREAYDNFMTYLRQVKKPNSMEPAQVFTRCLTLFRYVPFLSQSNGTAPDPIPEQQHRNFQMHGSKRWKTPILFQPTRTWVIFWNT
jgi:hypothetical protein